MHQRWKTYQDILFNRKKPQPPEEELQATITGHPNGLIVIQLNQSLQSIFLNEVEATAIAKALLKEARRSRIRTCGR
jgi:hypothetical protein